jgi:hypothetical protein
MVGTMRRRPMILVGPALVLALLAGCIGGPDPPSLADDPLVEVYRMPSPVPAPPPGEHSWAYTGTGAAAGIVAQGRRLASVDFEAGTLRWIKDLPPTYAVTGASDVLTAGAHLIVRGRSSIMAVRANDGSTAWERAAGPGPIMIGDGDNDPVVVHEHCDPDACELTGLDSRDGRRLWARSVATGTTLGPPRQSCGCFSAVSGRRISEIVTTKGTTRWSVTVPGTGTPVVRPSLYRLTVISPPEPPRCVATVRGLEDGKIVWKKDFPWYDAGAPTRTCTFDPSRLAGLPELIVPGPGTAAIVDGYHGTSQAEPLDAGEYVVTPSLAWSPAGYRVWTYEPYRIRVPAPADGRPWGAPAGGGWLLASGPGVVLYDAGRGVRWRSETASAVLAPYPDRLVFQEGNTLVALGPRPRDGQ